MNTIVLRKGSLYTYLVSKPCGHRNCSCELHALISKQFMRDRYSPLDHGSHDIVVILEVSIGLDTGSGRETYANEHNSLVKSFR